MLFNRENSLEDIFQTIKHELHRGALDAKHPFRFVTLATQSKHGVDARYVVLRAIDEELNFYVFSDARTSKVGQLTLCPEMMLLLYHPSKRIQVKVSGKAEIKRNDEVTASFWSKIQGDARKAYNQILSPGTVIKNPEEAFAWKGTLTDSNFTVIKIIPIEIEALQLDGLEHLRVVFKLADKNWDKSWLAP